MRSDHDFQVAGIQEVSSPVKVVVADTSPLNYLLLIDCISLLPSLYRHVLAPPSVILELQHIDSPPVVARWAFSLPPWLKILSPKMAPDASLAELDEGERDAILLALELSDATVLIDERKGRREAQARGLSIIGTLGVLRDGQEAGLADAEDGLHRLTQETSFRVGAELRQDFLKSLRASTKKDERNRG